ncbi:MAG: Mu-like prophage major head subunit gpT family protein [Verrucomicrobiota bacterium]
MPGIVNKSQLTAIERNFRTLFMEAMHGAVLIGSELAMRVPSSAAVETYNWLNAIPGMRELIGDVVIKNLSATEYSITNKEFEDTISVKEADIERDQLGLYSPLVTAMGAMAAEHEDELIFDLLINGFTEKDYTGSAFFATSKKHNPSGKSKTFSNKGTAVLSTDAFRTARENIKSRTNNEGRPMNLGRMLKLIVSPANESLAREIIEADRIDGTSGSKTNVDKGTADLIIAPRLASNPTYWYLIDTAPAVKALIVQDEKPAEIRSVTNPEDSHVVLKHEFLYQAYKRGNAGYGLPQLAYGSTGGA